MRNSANIPIPVGAHIGPKTGITAQAKRTHRAYVVVNIESTAGMDGVKIFAGLPELDRLIAALTNAREQLAEMES